MDNRIVQITQKHSSDGTNDILMREVRGEWPNCRFKAYNNSNNNSEKHPRMSNMSNLEVEE